MRRSPSSATCGICGLRHLFPPAVRSHGLALWARAEEIGVAIAAGGFLLLAARGLLSVLP